MIQYHGQCKLIQKGNQYDRLICNVYIVYIKPEHDYNDYNYKAAARYLHDLLLQLCSALGTAMLPVVAFPFEDFYIDTHHMTHKLEPREQQILFYTGLLAAALGIGGIRAILCPMGAYSLQGYNQHQLLSFFNWWVVILYGHS